MQKYYCIKYFVLHEILEKRGEAPKQVFITLFHSK